MQRNRLLARGLDGITLVGLTLYAAAVIAQAKSGVSTPVQPLLIWCVATWVGPSLARLLIVPAAASTEQLPNDADVQHVGGPADGGRGRVAGRTDSDKRAGRFAAYSDARDGARPPWWMLVARWAFVPVVLGGVLFHLNGRADLVSSLIQALIVVVLFGAFFRATIELVSLVATAIVPTKAAMVRRRAERTWNIVYFAGLPLLLLSRYHM